MDLVRAIGQYKKDNGITVLQIHRWTGIRQDRLQNGLSLGLTEQMILDLYELIHMESIQLQERIIHGKNEA
jgi:chorismate mutase